MQIHTVLFKVFAMLLAALVAKAYVLPETIFLRGTPTIHDDEADITVNRFEASVFNTNA
ncbi:hypothetical protein EUX98_g1890 [Antrodiella citrinella]|uniref:Uncharacterized protein n=1 Tax=Antrodiella citrinella TaxID=2447956 RepID=A0A4S4N2M9_9APHY|nr:hypothetical protein EUX98_g1890 [Antrodiella citrinella]